MELRGHRRRVRDRFLHSGLDSLGDHEITELLLTISIARVDTKATARELLSPFGSFAAVMDASPVELQEVMEVGPAAAAAIKIVKGAATAYLKQAMEPYWKTSVMNAPWM